MNENEFRTFLMLAQNVVYEDPNRLSTIIIAMNEGVINKYNDLNNKASKMAYGYMALADERKTKQYETLLNKMMFKQNYIDGLRIAIGEWFAGSKTGDEILSELPD